jgi:SAM-dependent methyltransferase
MLVEIVLSVVFGQVASAANQGVSLLRQEATALEPLVESKLATSFLKATADLPMIAPRTLYMEATRKVFTEAETKSLDQAARGRLLPFPVDESFYYTTKYGSPLAYARPIDLLGRAGLKDAAGLKVLDFGYGTIGQLRLLASLGADVTGVDVDPLFHALYSDPKDQGSIASRNGQPGRLLLLDGRFPAEPSIKAAVGGGYDLILSKNTLKRGYVHPERPVEKRRLINLEVDDAAFVRALHDVLKPGGWVMIYNICPAPSPTDQPYKPWADGRCPFPRSVWESLGFLVLEFDHDDTQAIRSFAHALGWDRGADAMDLKTDLFALYSLFRKAGKL